MLPAAGFRGTTARDEPWRRVPSRPYFVPLRQVLPEGTTSPTCNRSEAPSDRPNPPAGPHPTYDRGVPSDRPNPPAGLIWWSLTRPMTPVRHHQMGPTRRPGATTAPAWTYTSRRNGRRPFGCRSLDRYQDDLTIRPCRHRIRRLSSDSLQDTCLDPGLVGRPRRQRMSPGGSHRRNR